MWRAGNLPESSACPTAIDAYHKSTIISLSSSSAPSGAFHWWDIGSDGHVAMATDQGWAMMASCHVIVSWGDCIGITPVSTYTSTTGAKYLGWSYDYAKSEISDVHVDPSPSSVPRSATQDTGVPDTNYYKRQQIYVSLRRISLLAYYLFAYHRLLNMATPVPLMEYWERIPGRERNAVCIITVTQALTMAFLVQTRTKPCNA